MRGAPLVAAALLLAACRTVPPPAAPPGAAIAAAATELVGVPYRFGGGDAAGFDCSGLAAYVYARAGLAIPRTAAEQQRLAQPVALTQLKPGDLLFFSLHARGVDHVGVYLGGERFVHARRAGQAVAYGGLAAGGYYARHLASAGRYTAPGAPPSPP